MKKFLTKLNIVYLNIIYLILTLGFITAFLTADLVLLISCQTLFLFMAIKEVHYERFKG